MSKIALCFFKYDLAKLYHIFPIVHISKISTKLMHYDVFVDVADVTAHN